MPALMQMYKCCACEITLPRRQNSGWKSRIQRACRVQWGILFMGWMTFLIQHISPQLGMIDAPVLVGKSPHSQTGVSIPVNPYIHSVYCTPKVCHKTHVLLRSTAGGTSGVPWSKSTVLQWTFVSELTAFRSALHPERQQFTRAGDAGTKFPNLWCFHSLRFSQFVYYLSYFTLFKQQTGKMSVYMWGCCSRLRLFKSRQPCRVFEWAVEEVRIHLGLQERLVSHSQVKPWNLLGCSLFWTALLSAALTLLDRATLKSVMK